MTAVVPTQDTQSRYRIEPTVLQALRSPRILTREVLAGLVVAIALIPEAIAFSIIAGVDPRVGLFSSFVMAVAISFRSEEHTSELQSLIRIPYAGFCLKKKKNS